MSLEQWAAIGASLNLKEGAYARSEARIETILKLFSVGARYESVTQYHTMSSSPSSLSFVAEFDGFMA